MSESTSIYSTQLLKWYMPSAWLDLIARLVVSWCLSSEEQLASLCSPPKRCSCKHVCINMYVSSDQSAEHRTSDIVPNICAYAHNTSESRAQVVIRVFPCMSCGEIPPNVELPVFQTPKCEPPSLLSICLCCSFEVLKKVGIPNVLSIAARVLFIRFCRVVHS